jgi:hypothetical protein
MKNSLFFILFLLTISGCVEMRDWTGKKNGGVVAYSKHEFGAGEKIHDYYRIDENNYVIVNDTKNEIKQKLGLPAKIEPTCDGREAWYYPEKKVKLLFNGDYLAHWQVTNDR